MRKKAYCSKELSENYKIEDLHDHHNSNSQNNYSNCSFGRPKNSVQFLVSEEYSQAHHEGFHPKNITHPNFDSRRFTPELLNSDLTREGFNHVERIESMTQLYFETGDLKLSQVQSRTCQDYISVDQIFLNSKNTQGDSSQGMTNQVEISSSR